MADQWYLNGVFYGNSKGTTARILSDRNAPAGGARFKRQNRDADLVGDIGSHPITARLFGKHAIPSGKTVRLSTDPAKLFHFNADVWISSDTQPAI